MAPSEPKLLTFFEFCDRLKADGAYIGDDWHIYRKDGKPLSRQCRNGYYMVRKMYDNHTYHFMEHRVIWYFVHGTFDESLVINHKDFDRSNNDIANLELVTQSENIRHSLENDRFPDVSGSRNGRAYFTEKEVQAIRMMCKSGYRRKDVAELFDVKNANVISRIVTGARYGTVEDASTILAVYPLLVEKTSRHDLAAQERVKNAVMGLSGEAGEVVDFLKKVYYHGHEFDANHLIEELGDVMYYLCWLCNEIDIDFSELCFYNMKKLTERYPDGFDADRSIHRPEYEQEVAHGTC